MSPKTCMAELKRLIIEKVVASCWLFTSLYQNDALSHGHQILLNLRLEEYHIDRCKTVHDKMLRTGYNAVDKVGGREICCITIL